MLDWRPTRLAILRRGILSYLGACLALAITAGVIPEMYVDGLATLALAGLLPCGVGFDAEVMDTTDPKEKQRLWKLAYVVSAIRRQGQVRDVMYEVTLDGVPQAMDAAQVLIANFGGMGAGVKTRLEVEPDDGLLDVLVIRASGPLGGLLAGCEALRQDEPGESPEGHVFRTRARKVRVSTAKRRLVETDGSVAGTTPIRVSVRPAALTVIVPALSPGKHERSRDDSAR